MFPGMSCSVGCCQWPGIVCYHNGLFLWPCGHSRLYVVAASGALWYRSVPYLYLVLECRVGVWPQWYYPGGFNKRINVKGNNGSTEYIKLYMYMCVCASCSVVVTNIILLTVVWNLGQC